MSDLIDRWEALEALRQIPADLGRRELDDAIKAIESLPDAQPEILACGEGELTAQPEIIRCKDCRFGHRYFDVKKGHTYECVMCMNPYGLYRDCSNDSFCSTGIKREEE